jgi:replicative DNA helicase
MGKTSLALNIAEHVAVTLQKPVALFSLEMSKAEIAQRLLCSVGKVDQSRLKLGQLEDGDWMRVTGAMETLGSAPLYIDDSGAMTVMEMRAKARRLAARQAGGLAMVVVDYIQLMQASVPSDNRVQEISQISRSLKMLARDLDVPVLALSQPPARSSSARTSAGASPTCASRARSSRTPMSSCSSTATLLPQVRGRGGASRRSVQRSPRGAHRQHRNGPRSARSTCAPVAYTRFVDDYAAARA